MKVPTNEEVIEYLKKKYKKHGEWGERLHNKPLRVSMEVQANGNKHFIVRWFSGYSHDYGAFPQELMSKMNNKPIITECWNRKSYYINDIKIQMLEEMIDYE